LAHSPLAVEGKRTQQGLRFVDSDGFKLGKPQGQTGFSPDLRAECSGKNTQTALQASLQANLAKQFLKKYAAESCKIRVDSPQSLIVGQLAPHVRCQTFLNEY
jgi:hypothetical protein